jgi:arabinofuranosyltransferase
VTTIRKTARDPLFIALIFGYILWGCAFIYQSSFVDAGVRYFSLLDDEMISMRYARNLAHGFGLVYNPGGDRVEGFTNPLWVLYMALLHLLPVSPPKMSLLVQLTGLALLVLNLVVIKRLAESVSGGSRLSGLCAAFLTAFYVPLANWGLQGSEVCVVTLIVSASALMAIRCVESESSAVPLYLLLGVATLFRLDAFVPGLIVIGTLALMDPRRRWQHTILGTLVLALFLGAQTGFREYYYHDLLPNTYYLKMTGFPLVPRLIRGSIAAIRFLVEMNPILPILVVALLLLRRDWRLLFLGLMFGGCLAYSVWVGGDFVETAGGSNRFIAIAMPLFFVLLACALDSCASFVARTFSDSALIAKSGAAGILAVLTVLSLISADLPVRNEAPGFAFNDVSSLPCAALLLLNPPYGRAMNRLGVDLASRLHAMTDKDARIIVGGAGTAPYFADRFFIELLGKTDRVVARETWKPMVVDGARWRSFLPGHFKWDYYHSIVEMKPDLIIDLVPWDLAGAQPWLHEYSLVSLGGFFDRCYVRNGSPHVHVPPSLAARTDRYR